MVTVADEPAAYQQKSRLSLLFFNWEFSHTENTKQGKAEQRTAEQLKWEK